MLILSIVLPSYWWAITSSVLPDIPLLFSGVLLSLLLSPLSSSTSHLQKSKGIHKFGSLPDGTPQDNPTPHLHSHQRSCHKMLLFLPFSCVKNHVLFWILPFVTSNEVEIFSWVYEPSGFLFLWIQTLSIFWLGLSSVHSSIRLSCIYRSNLILFLVIIYLPICPSIHKSICPSTLANLEPSLQFWVMICHQMEASCTSFLTLYLFLFALLCCLYFDPSVCNWYPDNST